MRARAHTKFLEFYTGTALADYGRACRADDNASHATIGSFGAPCLACCTWSVRMTMHNVSRAESAPCWVRGWSGRGEWLIFVNFYFPPLERESHWGKTKKIRKRGGHAPASCISAWLKSSAWAPPREITCRCWLQISGCRAPSANASQAQVWNHLGTALKSPQRDA